MSHLLFWCCVLFPCLDFILVRYLNKNENHQLIFWLHYTVVIAVLILSFINVRVQLSDNELFGGAWMIAIIIFLGLSIRMFFRSSFIRTAQL